MKRRKEVKEWREGGGREGKEMEEGNKIKREGGDRDRKMEVEKERR